MILHNVVSARYAEPSPSFAIRLQIDAEIEGERETFEFLYRPDDMYGLNPDVAAWLMSNPDFEIAPYLEAPGPDLSQIDLPRREFRRALLHNGMDTSAVLAVFAAIADPVDREEMTIWWEDTTVFQRRHPILVDMVAAAGLTPEQGDAIWAYGVGLLNAVT